jgi:hypothetical protein
MGKNLWTVQDFQFYDDAMNILIESKYCLAACFVVNYYMDDENQSNVSLMRL